MDAHKSLHEAQRLLRQHRFAEAVQIFDRLKMTPMRKAALLGLVDARVSLATEEFAADQGVLAAAKDATVEGLKEHLLPSEATALLDKALKLVEALPSSDDGNAFLAQLIQKVPTALRLHIRHISRLLRQQRYDDCVRHMASAPLDTSAWWTAAKRAAADIASRTSKADAAHLNAIVMANIADLRHLSWATATAATSAAAVAAELQACISRITNNAPALPADTRAALARDVLYAVAVLLSDGDNNTVLSHALLHCLVAAAGRVHIATSTSSALFPETRDALLLMQERRSRVCAAILHAHAHDSTDYHRLRVDLAQVQSALDAAGFTSIDLALHAALADSPATLLTGTSAHNMAEETLLVLARDPRTLAFLLLSDADVAKQWVPVLVPTAAHINDDTEDTDVSQLDVLCFLTALASKASAKLFPDVIPMSSTQLDCWKACTTTTSPLEASAVDACIAELRGSSIPKPVSKHAGPLIHLLWSHAQARDAPPHARLERFLDAVFDSGYDLEDYIESGGARQLRLFGADGEPIDAAQPYLHGIAVQLLDQAQRPVQCLKRFEQSPLRMDDNLHALLLAKVAITYSRQGRQDLAQSYAQRGLDLNSSDDSVNEALTSLRGGGDASFACYQNQIDAKRQMIRKKKDLLKALAASNVDDLEKQWHKLTVGTNQNDTAASQASSSATANLHEAILQRPVTPPSAASHNPYRIHIAAAWTSILAGAPTTADMLEPEAAPATAAVPKELGKPTSGSESAPTAVPTGPAHIPVQNPTQAKKPEPASPATSSAARQQSNMATSSPAGGKPGFGGFGQGGKLTFGALATKGKDAGKESGKESDAGAKGSEAGSKPSGGFQFKGFSFGSGQNKGTTLFGGSKEKEAAEKAGEAEEEGASEEAEGGASSKFEAIVKLPDASEVKKVTGEEGQNVVFEGRCKLYRWGKGNEGMQWKERGVGTVKLLEDPATKRVRLAMWRDQVQRVAANHWLTGEMQLHAMPQTNNCVTWVAYDHSDDEDVGLHKFALRLKSSEALADFRAKFEAGCKAAALHGDDGTTTTTTAEAAPAAKATTSTSTATATTKAAEKVADEKTQGKADAEKASGPRFPFQKKDGESKPAFSFGGSAAKQTLAASVVSFNDFSGSYERDCICDCICDELACWREARVWRVWAGRQADVWRARCQGQGRWQLGEPTVPEHLVDKADRLMLPKGFFIVKHNDQQVIDVEATTAVQHEQRNRTQPATIHQHGHGNTHGNQIPVFGQGGKLTFGALAGKGKDAGKESGKESDAGAKGSEAGSKPSGGFQFKGFSFGSGQNKGTTLFGGSKEKEAAEKAGEAEEEGASEEAEGGASSKFEAIVKLPDASEVKKVTGEEGQNVVFEGRCKLYRWGKGNEGMQWKERGVGTVKLLEDPATKRVRLAMWRDQVQRVAANHWLTGEMQLHAMPQTNNCVTWVAYDHSDDEDVGLHKFALRLKSSEALADFRAKFEAGCKAAASMEAAISSNAASHTSHVSTSTITSRSAQASSSTPSGASAHGSSQRSVEHRVVFNDTPPKRLTANSKTSSR
ncbi:ran-binding protein 1 [Salpingoeca rosetta]|uniref:Ran-binding protein 1 n=1 Tax=Salpingoeca rosetta (strain ATCC 50818 / BSB-021) TaxID=946362 RepID=F2U4H0_SALR5|nr:ran-binding protein 1 [Salpingoeca rosetta]EGD82536.1 ran-binding protein 1 [Salpingoeca rosetta]|eukprot:XP_004995772.1 ran-binding protein 1 [Salpingoeca rosetta]